jgi:hypothetical protein
MRAIAFLMGIMRANPERTSRSNSRHVTQEKDKWEVGISTPSFVSEWGKAKEKRVSVPSPNYHLATAKRSHPQDPELAAMKAAAFL